MNESVLHLVELRSATWPALLTLAELTRAAPQRHRLLLLGGSNAARDAVDMGLRAHDRIAPALGRPELARRVLREYLGHRAWPDVIFAWSPRAASLARGAARDIPLGVVLDAPPPAFDRRAPGFFTAMALRNASVLLFPSRYLRDAWVARYTLLGSPSVVLPPMVDAQRLARADRAEIRREWRLPEDYLVIVGLGEPDRSIDARTLAHRAGTVWVAGRRSAVLAPPRAGQLERALRFGERHLPPMRILVDERPLPDLLAACDIGMWSDRTPGPALAERPRYSAGVGTVALHWARASGLMIVARNHPASREALDGAPRAALVSSPGPAADAKAILSLLAGPARGRITQTGLTPAAWIEGFEGIVGRAARRTSRMIFT